MWSEVDLLIEESFLGGKDWLRTTIDDEMVVDCYTELGGKA